jgi:hypothetical protein
LPLSLNLAAVADFKDHDRFFSTIDRVDHLPVAPVNTITIAAFYFADLTLISLRAAIRLWR